MSYGKLHENAAKKQKRVPPIITEVESAVVPMVNELENEPERELFMQTERKLRSRSNTKNVLLFCCGFVALVLIAAFVGYVFQEKVLQGEETSQHELHNKTVSNTSYFIISPTDTKREFELITLHNKLQILLISDNQTDSSAAAIDVAIGSNQDPSDYLGLAHFHEHMLFLGSERFPAEDAFSGFVSMNGGNDNAYTDNTHTNFFFEINNDHLSHALEIFSRFFVDPLLKQSAIMAEIWAVDNEYRKDIPNQDWREWRMLEHSANPSDPFSTFSIGSIDTLNKSGTYDKMRTFHNKYFAADIMKGVIYGNQNISTLRSYAKDYFSDIRKSNIEAPQYEETNPFTSDEKGLIYFIKPLDSTKRLSFIWSFVGNNYDLHRNYPSPVLDFIDSILRSRTSLSLFDYLAKYKGWIHDITGEGVIYDEYHWSGYTISFELTDSGLSQYEEITNYLFEYINLLQSNLHKLPILFQDYECMQSIQFKFYSLIKGTPYDTVSDIARRMQYRAQCDLLYTNLHIPPSRLVYNETATQYVLTFMADPNNLIIHKTSDDYDDYNLVEPYFGIPFATESINDRLLLQLKFFESTDVLQIAWENTYIDTPCNVEDIELIELSTEQKNNYNTQPDLVMNTANMKVWYKPDTQFNTPQIAINILLINPLLYNHALNQTYTRIWLKLMDYVASEWYSQPNSAGYTYDISINRQGLVIEITCINSKYLNAFLEELLNYILYIESISIDALKTELIVSNILNDLYDEYNKMNFKSVWYQGYDVLDDIVKKPYVSHNVMLDQILQLQAQDSNDVLQNVYDFVSAIEEYGFLVEILFHGNLYKSNIDAYLGTITEKITLRDTALLGSDQFVDNIQMGQHLNMRLNEDTKQWIYKGSNTNLQDTNNVNEFILQFSANMDHVERCKVLLMGKMMSSESYEVLRTQEALGYVADTVSKTSLSSDNINYVVVLVASGHYPADYLHERVLHFLHYFNDTFLNEMSDETFGSYVNATISDVKKEFLMLSDETLFLWNEILGHSYFWNKRSELEKILRGEEITLNKVDAFYQEYILGEKRKWLSLQLYAATNRSTTFANNITQHNYDLSGQRFEDRFVFFNSSKDLQHVSNISFFNVY